MPAVQEKQTFKHVKCLWEVFAVFTSNFITRCVRCTLDVLMSPQLVKFQLLGVAPEHHHQGWLLKNCGHHAMVNVRLIYVSYISHIFNIYIYIVCFFFGILVAAIWLTFHFCRDQFWHLEVLHFLEGAPHKVTATSQARIHTGPVQLRKALPPRDTTEWVRA